MSSQSYKDPTPVVPTPPLNRFTCLQQRTLLATFLNTRRHQSDDTLRQRLNSADSCTEYVEKELFPNWAQRKDVIDFCSREAQVMKKELDAAQTQFNDGEVADLRIDPYAQRSARDKHEQKYSEWSLLDSWCNNERTVEDILQSRSDSMLKDRCEYKQWIEEFKVFTRH